MEEQIKELSELYSLKNMQDYYKTVLLTTTLGKIPNDNKIFTIVGGQSGAGKSRLIPVTKSELKDNVVIVDFDELRSLHPNYEVVSKNYPEITHRILHKDTNNVKDKLLEELIEKGYNVIYEGALRDTQGFLNIAKKFKDNGYKVNLNIMAVPKLESFGSTFLRYVTALITEKTARWVEKSAHDSSYEGVIKTVTAFTEQNISDNVNVYIRGENVPKRIYSTMTQEYEDAVTAIKYGREIGRKKAVRDFETKYETVKTILERKEPELLYRLSDWKELYESEISYFKELIGGYEYSD